MKKTVVLILLLLLTSVWGNVCAGLYDNQSPAVVSSTELTLCTPGTFLLGNYEFAFPKADTTTNLQLEYFDMLNCYAQQANLTLLPSSFITEPTYDTICVGETYEWNGEKYTESGTYTKTLQNIYGCDSVVTLHLKVNQTQYAEETITACDSYTWNGETYTESGNYTYTTSASNGCDSIVTLHLTINNRDTAFFTETACNSYTWHGVEYKESGTYYYNIQTALGFDSVEVLNLTINYRDTAFFTETACDSYTWHNQIYKESGTYYYNSQTILGCDSVEVMRLTILPSPKYHTFDTLLCHGVTCVWRNKQLTTAGIYNDTIKNQFDCDSVIYTLDLEYLPDVQHLVTDTFLCYGEVCDWRGATYQEAGIYYDTIQNILSCDSIIYTLYLVIYPEIPITHVIDTMAGPEYHWNEHIYTSGGDHSVTLSSVMGCDSVVILHLVPNPAAIDTVIVYEQCAGSGEQDVEIMTQGFIEKMVFRCSPQALQAGLLDMEMPFSNEGIYTISYHNVRAGRHAVNVVGIFHNVEVAEYAFDFTYLYPNTIFEQRYNDLIAVLTHDYNGGYDFTAFQWYKDGMPIQGETHSYLNQSLGFEAEYSVLLTDTNGVQLMSCPIVPENKSELWVYPTIIQKGDIVKYHISEEHALYVYDSTGKIIHEDTAKEGTSEITLPQEAGVYMLRLVSIEQIGHTFKIIVR